MCYRCEESKLHFIGNASYSMECSLKAQRERSNNGKLGLYSKPTNNLRNSFSHLIAKTSLISSLSRSTHSLLRLMLVCGGWRGLSLGSWFFLLLVFFSSTQIVLIVSFEMLSCKYLRVGVQYVFNRLDFLRRFFRFHVGNTMFQPSKSNKLDNFT